MMNIKKYIGLALLPMVFTACQEDMLVNDQAQGIYTLKATVDKAAPASRAQIVLGGTSTTTETFHWNTGDEITIFEYDNAMPDVVAHAFQISENYDGQSASAEFTTTKALTVGKKFTAIYPATSSSDGKLKLTMDGLYTLADDSQDEWVKYFRNNMYMLATGTVAEGMNLEMQHLCSLIRVTYTNATDEDKEIYSVAANGHLFGYRAFSASNVNESANDDARYDRIGIRFDDSLIVPAGVSKDFYILVFSYFDEENYTWNGVNGITIAQPNNVYLSTPTTYNGQDFLLSDLNPGKSYWFNITQTTEGLVWTKDVNQGEEDDVTITFSNKELSFALFNELGAERVTMNPDSTAVMKQSDVLAVKELDFGWNDHTITSLSGIEQFVNLEFLRCCQTGLATCDLSQNKSLKDVQIYGSLLQSLDVTNLTELERLNCAGSPQLAELDLSNCKKLGSLDCSQTALDVINIPVPENMWRLCYGGNKDLQVDLSLYPKLTILGIYGMGLTTLNIPQSIQSKLVALYVSNNNLTTIDLTEYPNLENLECGMNNLTSLDLSVVPGLRTLYCDRNKISALDITALSQLELLHCGDQQDNINLSLTMTEDQKETWDNTWSDQNHSVSVKVAGAAQVITFTNKELSKALYAVLGAEKVSFNADSCAVMSQSDVEAVSSLDFYGYAGKANITSLEGLELFVNLEDFCCAEASVSGALKVTNSKLRYLDVTRNELTSLDVSGLAQLKTLVCSGNGELGNNINIVGTNVKDLQFHHTGASSLEFIPKNLIPQMENFDCGSNKFTSMDLSAFTAVKKIWISSNGLTGLILPKTESLEVLDMSHNPGVASVDLTQYPNLKEFYNQQNNLESIDVSKCPNLWLLYTNSNKLTELDLTNNPKIEHLICDDQQDGRILKLKLPEVLMDKWESEWCNFTNVILDNGTSNAGGGIGWAE